MKIWRNLIIRWISVKQDKLLIVARNLSFGYSNEKFGVTEKVRKM
jgi:hypothetical protein